MTYPQGADLKKELQGANAAALDLPPDHELRKTLESAGEEIKDLLDRSLGAHINLMQKLMDPPTPNQSQALPDLANSGCKRWRTSSSWMSSWESLAIWLPVCNGPFRASFCLVVA